MCNLLGQTNKWLSFASMMSYHLFRNKDLILKYIKVTIYFCLTNLFWISGKFGLLTIKLSIGLYISKFFIESTSKSIKHFCRQNKIPPKALRASSYSESAVKPKLSSKLVIKYY